MRVSLPSPPLDAEGDLRVFSYDITAALRSGLVGGCSSCHSSTVTWWELSACGMTPVTDASGHLTDYVPLHRECVLAVIASWAILIHGDPGEDEAFEPFTGDVPPPPSNSRPTPRSPRGAYARRSAGGS